MRLNSLKNEGKSLFLGCFCQLCVDTMVVVMVELWVCGVEKWVFGLFV